MRFGETRSETWYCDDNSLFNIDNKVPMDSNAHCTGTGKTISRNKSAWAPFMRNDGKCFYAHFKGKHKCYVTRDNNYRLCGCETFEDLVGEPYVKNPSIFEPVNGNGWHRVFDINCNNYCEQEHGLTCNLEEMLTGGAFDLCDMWDDRLEKKKNPSHRDSDKH